MNFSTTPEEQKAIDGIVAREMKLCPDADPISISMDITATHCNGTPLDLDRLLEADDANFMHDVSGIAQHIDRETGQLDGQFLPRFFKTAVGKGKLWWIADDQAELYAWKKEWEGKPIEIIGVNASGHQGSTRMNVIFQLEKAQANELLGYEVEEEEWLEE